MKRHLFLTGEIGAGKSTAISRALGDRLPTLGGFLTRRNVDGQGNPISFSLETPDGKEKAVFLDLSAGEVQIYMEVFETIGADSLHGKVLLLDEIGGIELLNPHFFTALETVLKMDIPILGVVKGKNASQTLTAKLGLSREYRNQTEKLWDILENDENTLVYTCEKYDEKALVLAEQWVREYCL